MPKGITIEMEQRPEQKGLTSELSIPSVVKEQDLQAAQLRMELGEQIARLQRYLDENRSNMDAKGIASAEKKIKTVQDQLFDLR